MCYCISIMNKFLLIFLLVFGMANVVSAQTNNRDEKIKTDIRNVMDKQVEAWNRGDVEEFMQGYWNSPELKFVSGDKITKGWQPTLDNYKKSYDSKAKMGVLTFSKFGYKFFQKIQQLSSEVGIWTGKLTEKKTIRTGNSL